ncbi:MAG: hypothetical protein ABIZ56_01075 [Chthoniobacteraceae bacterium]
MNFFNLLRLLRSLPDTGRRVELLQQSMGHVQQAIGRIEERQLRNVKSPEFSDYEFKVHSQWGEDGIIQFLIRSVPIARPIFIEFGVQDYTEANTRFLLTNNNWSGLILDGSDDAIASIQRDPIYWRYNLKAAQAFVTRENVNSLIESHGLSGEIGLLSVDIDGVDYFVWEAITVVQPALVIAEYNARFGPERAVTVPYDAAFQRGKAHHSNIYYGASLAALVGLGKRKGYAFVGANSAGNNAFFVRRDLRPADMRERTARDGFVACKFREARDENGRLTFLDSAQEKALLAGLSLVEVEP